MINKEKQLELFFENIEDASEHFNMDAKGNLYTTVNTEYLFPSYNLEIVFHNSFVQILTRIENDNLIISDLNALKALENLLNSLNLVNKNGQFFFDRKAHRISFMALCYLEDIINADNPWSVLFCGIETINHFAESIDNVLYGSEIFYICKTGN